MRTPPPARSRPLLTGEILLRAEGIGRSFGGRPVLRSAALWAEAGSVTALVGRNGTGKTTLMRIAAGALRADHGSLSFRGVSRKSPSAAALAREGLLFLPQDSLLCRGLRVTDHLRALISTLQNGGIATLGGVPGGAAETAEARTARLAEELGVAPLLHHRTEQLSRGERMRVILFLALVRRPLVLLADEALAGIAPRDGDRVATALRRLAGEGCAVVVSGHEVNTLLTFADQLLWCTSGTTRRMGAPAETLADHAFRRDYLGPGFRG